MTTLLVAIITVLEQFAPLFRREIWTRVQIVVIGVILAPGKRTVTSVLRVMGLSQEGQFQKYHRLLNRSRWSSLAVSRVLLQGLVAAFVPVNAPIVASSGGAGARLRPEGCTATWCAPVRVILSKLMACAGSV